MRKNDLRRNGEFFSTQKLPEVKCTVVAVPLNRRNCQSLEGKESSKDDEESIRRNMQRHGQVRKEQVGTGKVKSQKGTGNLMILLEIPPHQTSMPVIISMHITG